MDFILVETKRLIVRPFKDEDFEPLLSLMMDADSMQYTGFKKPQSKEKVRSLLSKWKKEGLQKMGVWAVRTKHTNDFVGWVMLKPNKSETPELGYMIHKPQCGKGYASEVASQMLNYGADTLSMKKIIAVTSPENKASIRVLEKIGMKKIDNYEREDGVIGYEVVFE